MSLSMLLPLLEDLPTTLRNIEISRYASLASYTVLIYDMVLTLPYEVQFIWMAKWSIVKILFFMVRYINPIVITADVVGILGITPLTNKFCQRAGLVYIFYQVTALALMNIIVSLRIHALYRRSRRVFVTMSILFTVTYAATYTLVALLAVALYPNLAYSNFPGIELCYTLPVAFMWTVWLPGVIFEGIILLITLVKTYQHYTVDRLSLKEAVTSSGVIYFVITFLVRLMTLLLLAFAPLSLMLLGENFAFSVISAAGSRMLINLRGVKSEEDWSEATDVLTSQVSLPKTPVLWLADQGGQSFLEQIYQRSYSPEVKPSFTYLEEFNSS